MSKLISVADAERLVLCTAKDYGSESVAFGDAVGRVLAIPLVADRDMPPFNRVTMDGIAINFKAVEQGISSFQCKGIQAAGDKTVEIENINQCVEIMTGSALPASTDTIICYENISIKDGVATLQKGDIKKAQNVHTKAKDKKQNEVIVEAGRVITPAVINAAASVGATQLCVKKLPSAVIISTGNELVAVEQQPSVLQIRQSNGHTIRAALQSYHLNADLLHIQDDPVLIKNTLENCLKKYDVLLLSGAVSAGKFDLLPQALTSLGVEQLFHKVAQKPGKPFWFGKSAAGVLVFAFPGNPVSTFICLQRYFIPWLERSIGIKNKMYHAVLNEAVFFMPAMHYFLLVKLQWNEHAQWLAHPVAGNGSGDLVGLAEADAFIELPADKAEFQRGKVYRVWPFQRFF